MTGFRQLTAIAAPLRVENIDTDQIYPARFIGTERGGNDVQAAFLHEHRFDGAGAARPDFVLNQPKYQGAQILVTARNYGCGSARLGALVSHRHFGISALISESFGALFGSVSFKSGILAITLPAAQVEQIMQRLDGSQTPSMQIDVEAQTVTDPQGGLYHFEIDPFVKYMFSNGLSEIELTQTYQTEIAAMRAAQLERMPWLAQNLAPTRG